MGLFVAGLSLGAHSDSRNSLRSALPPSLAGSLLGPPGLFPLQQEVLQQLRGGYYRTVDPNTLETSTIQGMLAGLDDPYTTYFTPKEYGSFKEHTEGQYSGLGMVVEMKNGFVTVISTFKGSPAQEGGIRPGDLVIGVDGKTTRGASLDEVVDRIKGVSGTKVKLQIYRLAPGTTTTSLPPASDGTETVPHLPDGGLTKDFSLVRREISIPVVEAEERTAGSKKVAYIRFSTFSDGSGAELRKAVTKAVGTEKVDALVVDLRSNGGGLLSEAVHVASIFIPSGVIVTTQGLHSPKETYAAEGGAISDKVPVYLLVDGYSAERLRDRGRRAEGHPSSRARGREDLRQGPGADGRAAQQRRRVEAHQRRVPDAQRHGHQQEGDRTRRQGTRQPGDAGRRDPGQDPSADRRPVTAPAGGRRPDRPSAGSGFRPRFFLDGPALGLDRRDLAEGRLQGRELTLSSDDARHARTVLRARSGDPAEVVIEPWRQLVPATFASLQPSVTLRLLPSPAEEGERAGVPAERLAVALVQALPQPASLDLIVEKGTEVGVDVFVVVSAEGSPAVPTDRLDGRVRRWRRIASEAAKQSKQLARPRLTVAPSLAEAASIVEDRLREHLGWSERSPAAGVHHIVLDPSAAGSLEAAVAEVARREPEGGPAGRTASYSGWGRKRDGARRSSIGSRPAASYARGSGAAS